MLVSAYDFLKNLKESVPQHAWIELNEGGETVGEFYINEEIDEGWKEYELMEIRRMRLRGVPVYMLEVKKEDKNGGKKERI
jgi:hypothetical protein